MSFKQLRVTFQDGNMVLYDFTAIAITSNTVNITIPEAPTEALVTGLGSYDVGAPNQEPMTITPDSVTPGAVVFPDGVYRVRVTSDGDEFDERVLYIPVIDNIILEKTDSYLRASCDSCKNQKALTLLQELVVIRQAVQLDINHGRFADAASKVVLLTNISLGGGCACICGCA